MPDLAQFREALLYNERGKWKYTVYLDYKDVNYESWDLWGEARKALARATRSHFSGVTFHEIPKGWMLVVPDPIGKTSHPIMVIGDNA